MKLTDLDPRVVAHGGSQEVDPVLDRKQRLLGDVDGHRHQQMVDKRQAPPDEVLVSAGDGVEGAGVDGDASHRTGVGFELKLRIADCRSAICDLSLGQILKIVTAVPPYVRVSPPSGTTS